MRSAQTTRGHPHRANPAILVRSSEPGWVIQVGAGLTKSLRGVWRLFFWWFRRLLGRRVCGVAVKAERPQAKPRTYGLEGGVVRAMLVEPGRRNVRT